MGSEHKKGGISVDWNKLKAEYIAGGTSYRKLAEKYDVPLSTLSRIAGDEKWVEQKEQVEDKVSTAVSEKTAESLSESAILISKTTEKLLINMSCEVEEGTLTSARAEFFKSAGDALKRFKDIVGFKSPKDIEEQEARINNLKRQAEQGNTDNTATLTIDKELEEYAR